MAFASSKETESIMPQQIERGAEDQISKNNFPAWSFLPVKLPLNKLAGKLVYEIYLFIRAVISTKVEGSVLQAYRLRRNELCS